MEIWVGEKEGPALIEEGLDSHDGSRASWAFLLEVFESALEETIGGVEFSGIGFDVGFDQGLVRCDVRAETAPLEPIVSQGSEDAKVAGAQVRNSEEAMEEGFGRVVGTCEWIERDSTLSSVAGAFSSSKCFIGIVWDEVKSAGGVEVEEVIAGADPVSVAIDEGIFEGEEAEGFVDIQDGGECRFEFIERGGVEGFAKLDEGMPCLWVIG